MVEKDSGREQVVKTIRKEPMTKQKLFVQADHENLVEKNCYDVAGVRIRMTDENGNILPFYNDPVVLSVQGPIEIIGPQIISLQGGMGGTYVKTRPQEKEGNKEDATLTILSGTCEEKIHFKVNYI